MRSQTGAIKRSHDKFSDVHAIDTMGCYLKYSFELKLMEIHFGPLPVVLVVQLKFSLDTVPIVSCRKRMQ